MADFNLQLLLDWSNFHLQKRGLKVQDFKDFENGDKLVHLAELSLVGLTNGFIDSHAIEPVEQSQVENNFEAFLKCLPEGDYKSKLNIGSGKKNFTASEISQLIEVLSLYSTHDNLNEISCDSFEQSLMNSITQIQNNIEEETNMLLDNLYSVFDNDGEFLRLLVEKRVKSINPNYQIKEQTIPNIVNEAEKELGIIPLFNPVIKHPRVYNQMSIILYLSQFYSSDRYSKTTKEIIELTNNSYSTLEKLKEEINNKDNNNNEEQPRRKTTWLLGSARNESPAPSSKVKTTYEIIQSSQSNFLKLQQLSLEKISKEKKLRKKKRELSITENNVEDDVNDNVQSTRLIEDKYEDIIQKLKNDHNMEIDLLNQNLKENEEDYLELIDSFKATNENLIGENVKLKEEIEILVENEEKLTTEKNETEELLTEQLMEMKAENDQLRQQIELLLHKCDKKDADFQRVQKELQREIELLEEDNYNLQIELDNMKSQDKSLSFSQNGDKVNNLNDADLLERNNELEKKINELILQQSNSQKYKEEIIELTTLLEMMQNDMDELKKLSLDAPQEGIEPPTSAKSESNRDFESREIVLGLKQEIAELNRLLDEEKKQNLSHQQQRNEFENNVSQLQKEVENVKAGFDRRLVEANGTISNFQKQATQLQEQLNDKIGVCDLLSKENSTLKSNLNEANEKVDSINQQQAKIKQVNRDLKLDIEIKGIPTLLHLKKRLDELDKTSSLHKCSWRNLTSAVQAIAETDVQKQKMYLMRSQWGI